MHRLVRAFPLLPGKREAESHAPFETWFKGRVLELCGVDPNRQPEGPPAKPLFDWLGLA